MRSSIACASAVGYIMALTQMPGKITAFFLSISSNKNVILFLINVLLLVLGCFVDMAPSIPICTPILLPVMVNFGVDPVHFGMIMMLNLGIGLCHPPVGSILFVGCAVGKVKIEDVMRRNWPFYGVMFAVLMLVTYVPEISLWFPKWVLQRRRMGSAIAKPSIGLAASKSRPSPLFFERSEFIERQ